ncbi:hypothetical protein C9374_012783 [Naegleria lovaniensis]|uniref:Mitochondrial chaperone BCS1 n=1 Tax=Naegleria lovaniensis TaxID=51637 RepID=A0AA88GB04_NAELO|nr:uncharacterized protein C9374_012783 [Naegleria lovaniensis]KAG2373181.1 hypothetical protein C9374_012783 [Naegleria lovaniensis]
MVQQVHHGTLLQTTVETLTSENNSSSPASLLSSLWMKFIQMAKSLNIGHFYLFLGSLGLGTVWYTSINYFIQRSFVSKLYISSNDEAFHWFMFWLAENKYSQEANHFAILSSKTHVDFSSFKHNPSEKDKHSIPIKFIPSPGVHFLKYKGKSIKIEYERTLAASSNSGSSTASHNEQLIVSCLSTSPTFLKNFITDCQQKYLESKHGKTLIYLPDAYCDFWEPRISKLKRPPNTVKLQSNIFEKLLNDARNFLSLEKWYNDHGIPFRRGYLLYGPPGTGKTSTVTALAGALDKNICCINISNKNLNDDNLNSLLLNTPYNSIILLEDIDACFTTVESKKRTVHPSQLKAEPEETSEVASQGTSGSNVTLGGLLNCIDGVVAQEGRILFMTTNHIHRLPDALIRPGRIDVKYLIDCADETQTRELFLNFYPHEFELADKFCQKLFSDMNKEHRRRFTCAELQGHFMTYKHDPASAVSNTPDLIHFDLRRGLNVIPHQE